MKKNNNELSKLYYVCFAYHFPVEEDMRPPAAANQRPNSWAKSWQKFLELSSSLFTVTYTALPWDFYFLKLTQPLTVSEIQLMYTVNERGGIPDRKPYPLPYGLWNLYRNLKSRILKIKKEQIIRQFESLFKKNRNRTKFRPSLEGMIG